MALQPDGKIVLAGYIVGGIVAVARLNSDGSPDGTFSTDGRAMIDFGDRTFGNAVALQKNGRILVAGDLRPVGVSVPARWCGAAAEAVPRRPIRASP
jgi:uncharacterized delta-60 repeat protein